MSVDIKDHRRYADGKLAESLKQAEQKVAQAKLLEQAHSEVANTGDERLDKYARSIQDLLNKAEAGCNAAALKGITCVQEDLVRLQQFEYFFLKGQVEILKKVLEIPAQILVEEKPKPVLEVVK